MSSLNSYLDAVRKASTTCHSNEERKSEVVLGYVKSVTAREMLIVVVGSSKSKYVRVPTKDNVNVNLGYDLNAFSIVRDGDNGEVIEWSLDDVAKYTTVHEFVAVLANGKILADDGRPYYLYDDRNSVVSSYNTHLEYLTSLLAPNVKGTIKLYTIENTIYGIGYDYNDYKYCEDSNAIPDALETYVDYYNR